MLASGALPGGVKAHKNAMRCVNDDQSTLGEAISVVRQLLLATGSYLARVEVAGVVLKGDALRAMLGQPVSQCKEVALSSHRLTDALSPTFQQSLTLSQACLSAAATAGQRLSQGDRSPACEHVVSLIGILPLFADQMRQAARVMAALGWPPERDRGLGELPEQLDARVAELDAAFRKRDFGRLQQLLAGPLAASCRKATRVLHYLARRVERPRHVVAA